MRKIFSVLLVLGMLLTMSFTAFAADPETVGKNGSKEIDVTAKYESSTTTPEVYSVDISWSSMTFTYTESGTKTWNAADHSYDASTQGAWDKTTATITVTNHSNVSVDLAVTYTPANDTGITGTLANGTATLDAGVEGNYAGADSHTATLTISGTPNNTITSDGVKIGTVKVTIE